MTDVYGHFFDVLEELNHPENDADSTSSKQQVAATALRSGTDVQKKSIINHFFKTMERLNLCQVEEFCSTIILPVNLHDKPHNTERIVRITLISSLRKHGQLV